MTDRAAMVVDDSSTSRMLLTKILRKMGIQCQQAQSGEEALELLTETQPDFIFLDHLMPGLDGFQTLKKIKQNPQLAEIPVIMYTSQHASKYYEEAHALGAAGVISKQIDREKLYLMLNRLCLETPEEESIPTIYEEVRKPLRETSQQHEKIDLTGRITTLESTCEELHEENRQLKIEIANLDARQEENRVAKSKLSFTQVVFSAALAAALFLAMFSWLRQERIENELIKVRHEISVIHDLIKDVVDLIETSDTNQ